MKVMKNKKIKKMKKTELYFIYDKMKCIMKL